MARLFAGTSGFAYETWKPAFYPEKLPAKRFLEHYATRLNAVEINYTFHRMPNRATLEGWTSQTPPEFVFAVKAHQRITHVRRLRDAAEAAEAFFRAVDPLRSARRLGPVLFQLPPNLKADHGLLREFLTLLPRDLRHAFEFRHPSWLNAETYALLEAHDAALCLAESEKLEIPQVLTARFVYWRLRMPEYSAADRARIAEQAGRWLAGGRDLYLFFKHEETPEGVLYASEVLARLQGSAPSAAPPSS
jgi:uncharacterized protein YecE (DUF72 family)